MMVIKTMAAAFAVALWFTAGIGWLDFVDGLRLSEYAAAFLKTFGIAVIACGGVSIVVSVFILDLIMGA